MNNKKVYILEDRGILFIQGEDSKEFLQNIITNDIDKVDDSNSCFASILTPQGKYLYDCLLYTSPSPRDKRQSRMPSSA